MSDVERPARDMADIAKRFLRGARQMPENGRPHRVGPKDRTANPPAQNNAPPVEANRQPRVPPPPPSSHEVPPPILENCKLKIENSSPLPRFQIAPMSARDDAWPSLAAAAAALAREHNLPLALIGLSHDDLIVDLVSPDPEAPVLALPEVAGGTLEVRVARTLAALARSTQHWIFAIPVDALAHRTPQDDSSLVEPLAQLQQTITDILLLAGTDKDTLITAYQTLKRACGAMTLGPGRLRAFMVADDFAEAAAVHTRLRSAARGFLNMDLALAGVAAPLEEWEPLAVLYIGPQRHAVWEAVLDLVTDASASPDASQPSDVESALATVSAAVEQVHLDGQDAAALAAATFDHLANVLDPEERAALNLSFDIRQHVAAKEESPALEHDAPEAPAELIGWHGPDWVGTRSGPCDGRSEVSQPNAAVETIQTPPVLETCSLKLETSSPALRAVDVLTADALDRSAQWDVLTRSVRDFMEAPTILETSSPLEAESLLALDAAGRLHVWTLARDLGAGANWSALWQWAREHRHILALTRRDAKFDPAAPVIMHVVLPLDFPATARILYSPLPELHWYRLRALEWHARRALVLVPVE